MMDTKQEWASISVAAVNQENLGPYRVRIGTTPQRVYAAEEFFPVLIFGPQRSGKTSGFAVPALLDWGGPAVVTSVRRDVLDDTYQWRQKQGNVYVFDPSGSLMDTQYQEFRHSWDFLDQCRSWDDCIRMGWALTESGRLGGINDQQFWYSLAGQLLAPHLFAATMTGRGISEIVHWIKTQEESEVQSILQSIGHDSALASAEDAWNREDRARSSVYTTLRSVLRAFDYDDSGVGSPPFLDIDAFLSSTADTLYLCAPPDEQEEYKPLFTGLVRTIIRNVYVQNTSAKDKRQENSRNMASPAICPLLVLLDEAGNIAPLENLDTLATTAAGTKIQLVSIFHDLSQMESVYDQYTARSIVNNHSALLALPGMRDVETLSYVQNLLHGERVANSTEATWNSPRPLRGLQIGEALLIYGNKRPIVLSHRSKFTDSDLNRRVLGDASGR